MTRYRWYAFAGVLLLCVFAAWQTATIWSQQKAPVVLLSRPIINAGSYSSLQAAIDALPSVGGKVYVPAGTIELSQPLRITQQDVLIEGAGTATEIKNVNTEGLPAIIIESPQIKDDPKAVLWRVQLSNLRITGNEKSGVGILARHINEIFLHGITVSHHGGDGIQLDNCYEDPRICDCLLTYNKANGLNLIGCHDIVVGNQFEENLDALRCVDSFNLCMTGNNLDDHLRDGVVIENTYGSVVSGNMIEECNGRAIVLDRDCYGITLSANVIAHNGGGIDFIDAHGCAVSANTFTINKANGLKIGPASGRVAITGNSFSSSFIGDGKDKREETDRSAAGIALSGTNQITIVGNTFTGLTTKAITQEGDPSREVLVNANVIERELASDLPTKN